MVLLVLVSMRRTMVLVKRAHKWWHPLMRVSLVLVDPFRCNLVGYLPSMYGVADMPILDVYEFVAFLMLPIRRELLLLLLLLRLIELLLRHGKLFGSV